MMVSKEHSQKRRDNRRGGPLLHDTVTCRQDTEHEGGLQSDGKGDFVNSEGLAIMVERSAGLRDCPGVACEF